MTETPHPADDFERAMQAPTRVGGDDDGAQLSDEQVALLNSLFDLARSGDPRLMHYISQGIPVDLADHKGDTFLILAAYAGQGELARQLLTAGADVDALNQRGQSALTCAVFRGDTELVTTLVEAGADPTLGAQNAVATATAFDRKDLLPLLRPED
jgi:ankyrin repeat protein